MKNNFEVKYKKNARIISDSEQKYIEKNKTKNLKDVFSYLDSRDFLSHPAILDVTDDKVKYKYIEDSNMPKEDREKEFFRTIALLHYKTSKRKTVTKKKYKNIYTKVINNIDCLKEEYEALINNAEEDIYMSPSNYLLARNYKIINECLLFCEKEINSWYRQVENDEKQRICLIHNNLELSHFIINNSIDNQEHNYLISWDKTTFDTPVLDLYKLYLHNTYELDFIEGLKIYNETTTLSKSEIKLLYILISLPPYLSLDNDEYSNTLKIKHTIKKIIKTHNLITANIFQIEKDEKNK